MKKILLILLIPVSLTSCNKDRHKDEYALSIIENYYIEGTCKNVLQEDFVFSDERHVAIKKNGKSELFFEINIDFTPDFEAFMLDDSLFIPLQLWKNFDETQASFQAHGLMIDDSLFLHYGVGGTFGIFDCNCKGKKITSQ